MFPSLWLAVFSPGSHQLGMKIQTAVRGKQLIMWLFCTASSPQTLQLRSHENQISDKWFHALARHLCLTSEGQHDAGELGSLSQRPGRQRDHQPTGPHPVLDHLQGRASRTPRHRRVASPRRWQTDTVAPTRHPDRLNTPKCSVCLVRMRSWLQLLLTCQLFYISGPEMTSAVESMGLTTLSLGLDTFPRHSAPTEISEVTHTHLPPPRTFHLHKTAVCIESKGQDMKDRKEIFYILKQLKRAHAC